MINEQVEKYQKNEIEINYNIFEGYSSIMDLKPYAKAIFVDKKENVLKYKMILMKYLMQYLHIMNIKVF